MPIPKKAVNGEGQDFTLMSSRIRGPKCHRYLDEFLNDLWP